MNIRLKIFWHYSYNKYNGYITLINNKIIMKKYIKIDKNTTEEMAIKHLESLGGTLYDKLNKYSWRDFIKLDNENDIYYTCFTQQELKEDWFEEIILDETFKVGEQVACSDVSKEKAIEDLINRSMNFYYTWYKTSKWKYIIEDEDWDVDAWRYIAKIPKEEIEELTMDELEKELWRKIKIIK